MKKLLLSSTHRKRFSDEKFRKTLFLIILILLLLFHFSSLIHILFSYLDCQDQLLDNLINYYDEFGCRSCCFVDVAPYIDMLNEDHRNQVCQSINQSINYMGMPLPCLCVDSSFVLFIMLTGSTTETMESHVSILRTLIN